MQYIQNNFTVENIVAKYRNYVKEHCPKSSEFDGYEQFDAPFGYYGNTDEQLLATLYKRVAGKKADKKVLKVLAKYADAYCPEALSEAELSFLCSNIGSCVNYLFSNLKKTNSIFSNMLPEEQVESIIKENAIKKEGATIFIGNNNGDIACLFPQCKITGFISENYKSYNEEVWALVMIRLFANGIHSEIRMSSGECLDKSYLGDVDCVVWGVDLYSKKEHLDNVYSQLKPGAQMILFFADNEVAGKEKMYSLRKSFVEDMAIKSIISFEHESIWGIKKSKTIVLLIEKGIHNIVHIENRISNEKFDIGSKELDCDILWPSYYSTKKPQAGIPLSKLVSIIKPEKIKLIKKEKDLRFSEHLDDEAELEIISNLDYRFQVNWTLPEEIKTMPVVSVDKMATDYKDANVLSKELKLAGDPIYDEDWRFRMTQIKEKSVLLYGNEEKTVVGYINELPDTGVVTMMPIVRFKPKKGYDVRYIAALLLSDEVKNQIRDICENSINNYTMPLIFDKVIVPAHSLKERLAFLSEANYTALLITKLEMSQKQINYTKAVRNRKHALSQSLSSIEAIFDPLNQYRIRNGGVLKDEDVFSSRGTTVRYAFEYLSKHIEELMPVLDHIADVEYTFDKPEQIDPEEFIEKYINKEENGWVNFKAVITWEKGHNRSKFNLDKSGHIITDAEIDRKKDEIICHKGEPLSKIIFPIDALERIFDNIVSNAKSHAFTDVNRKNYLLRFSWKIDGTSLVIMIENNGTPIPEDRDTNSLLEYGVSSCLHQNGHNGIGCNEIEDIMSRYNGTVRIISSPKDEYTVKYVLTFNYSNTKDVGLENGY